MQAADLKARLALLLRHGLLTDYQVARLRAGNPSGLTLGNYQEIRVRHFEAAVDRYVGSKT